MGTTPSVPQPPQPPLNPAWVSDKERTFYLQELPDQDTDYAVSDEKGQRVLLAQGGYWHHSKNGRHRVREMLDVKLPDGTGLFCLRSKRLTLHGTWRVEPHGHCRTARDASTALATFRRNNGQSLGLGAVYRICRGASQVLRAREQGVSMDVTFTDHEGKPQAQATIASRMARSKQYKVTCQPGVDALLCLMAVMYIDII